MAIGILEKEVGPKFNSRKNLAKHGIHKQINNRYHKVFVRIVEYLEDARGDHSNRMESLIRDYLMSVYEYYNRFSRIPAINQLSPSTSNQIRFEEWIYDSIREHDEEYWVHKELKMYKIIEVPIEPIEIDLNFIET